MLVKESELYLYADDAKVFKHIKNEFDSQVLQDDLIKMKQQMEYGFFG